MRQQDYLKLLDVRRRRHQEPSPALIDAIIKAFVANPRSKPLTRGTWTHGGCWILADAIQRVWGGDMWVIGSDNYDVEHFVVRFGDLFADGDGLQTAPALRVKMMHESGIVNPRLLRYHPGMDTSSIRRPELNVVEATRLLRSYMRSNQ